MCACVSSEILAILRDAMPDLRRDFGVVRLGVFGSVAEDTATDNSDVDVIVQTERPLGLRFMELADAIERLVGRPADVLTEHGLDSIRSSRASQRIRRQVTYV